MIIITKDYCPYCVMAKELLTSLKIDFQEIDVSNNAEKLSEIMQISQMRTVPQIFKNEISKENLIGGYTDLKKLYDEGKLL